MRLLQLWLAVIFLAYIGQVLSDREEDGGGSKERHSDDNKEYKSRQEGFDCDYGKFEQVSGRSVECCRDKGRCKDSSCKAFGFKNSAKANCAWKKQDGSWKADPQNPSACKGLYCQWSNDDCTGQGFDAHCYGVVKCDTSIATVAECANNKLVGQYCLQDGKNRDSDTDCEDNKKDKRGGSRKINFKVCSNECTTDDDCPDDKECKNKICVDPFIPSGDPDDGCKCEDRYRSAACRDLEDGGVNADNLRPTSGFIKVTVPQCGIAGAWAKRLEGEEGPKVKLTEKYGCTQQVNTCDQDWVCDQFIPQWELDYLATQVDICYTTTLPTKEDVLRGAP